MVTGPQRSIATFLYFRIWNFSTVLTKNKFPGGNFFNLHTVGTPVCVETLCFLFSTDIHWPPSVENFSPLIFIEEQFKVKVKKHSEKKKLESPEKLITCPFDFILVIILFRQMYIVYSVASDLM